MNDPFGHPENLRDVPVGLWPSPCRQRMECGHVVETGELIGRYDGEVVCDTCQADGFAADREYVDGRSTW